MTPFRMTLGFSVWLLAAAAWLDAAPALVLPPNAPPADTDPSGALKAEVASLKEDAKKADAAGDRMAETAATGKIVELSKTIWGPTSREYASALHRHALSLDEVSRYEEEEELLRQALAIQAEHLGEHDPDTLKTLHSLGNCMNYQGRFGEADELLQKAYRARVEVLGERHASTLTTMGAVVINLIDQSRFEEAAQIGRALLRLRMEALGPEHSSIPTTLSSLGHALDHLGRFDESEPLRRRAVELRTKARGPDHEETVRAVSNLGLNLLLQGKFAEAERTSRAALEKELAALGPEHEDVATSRVNIADALIGLGRPAEAVPLLEQARSTRGRILSDRHPYVWQTADRLANALLMSGSDPAKALSISREGARFWRARRLADAHTIAGEAQHERDSLQHMDLFRTLADANWAAHPHRRRGAGREEAFAAVQEGMAGNVTRALAAMAARREASAESEALGRLVNQRQELADAWRSRDAAASAAIAAGKLAERRRLDGEISEIEQSILAVDAALRRTFPGYQELVRGQPVPLREAQRLLRRDEALLLVAPSRLGTHIVAVTQRDVKWVRSAWNRKAVDAAVRRLRESLTAPLSAPVDAFSPYDRATAHRLYLELVAPVSKLLAGKKHVLIAADGTLAGLPFGALVTGAPVGRDDDPDALRRTPWLSDAHALVQIPSVQSLRLLRKSTRGRPRAPQNSEAFAGFGDPVLSKPSDFWSLPAKRGMSPAAVFGPARQRSGKALADLQALRSLPELPGTAEELENMRKALSAPPGSVRLRGEATESALRSTDLSNVRILALATHGLLAGELPGEAEAGLVLTPPGAASEEDDGYLAASEIARLKLSAEWVILSACNTAGSDGAPGAQGLSGLARAFFYAGGKTLLVSHWPLVDDVAARLTVDAIRRKTAQPSLSKAEALQEAMRALRNTAEAPEWAHPAAWAPFTLVGDGSS